MIWPSSFFAAVSLLLFLWTPPAFSSLSDQPLTPQAQDRVSDIQKNFPKAIHNYKTECDPKEKFKEHPVVLTGIWFAGWRKDDLPESCTETPKVLIGGKNDAPVFFPGLKTYLEHTPDNFTYVLLTDKTTLETNQKEINILKSLFGNRFQTPLVEDLGPKLLAEFPDHADVLKPVLQNATGGAPVITSDILRWIALPYAVDLPDNQRFNSKTTCMYLDIDAFLLTLQGDPKIKKKKHGTARNLIQRLLFFWDLDFDNSLCTSSDFQNKLCVGADFSWGGSCYSSTIHIGSGFYTDALSFFIPSKTHFQNFSNDFLKQAQKNGLPDFAAQLNVFYKNMLKGTIKAENSFQSAWNYSHNSKSSTGPQLCIDFFSKTTHPLYLSKKLAAASELSWLPGPSESQAFPGTLAKKMYPEPLWKDAI